MNNLHEVFKNADGKSKFNITKLNPWKLAFWKQLVIEKDETKVSVILANTCEVKVGGGDQLRYSSKYLPKCLT